jgi:hypothetical protein
VSSLDANQRQVRDQLIWRRFHDGEAMVSIARDLGITRERVRQIVNRQANYDGQGPSPSRYLRNRQQHQRVVQERRRQSKTTQCPVCLSWHTVLGYGARRTCSSLCALAWREARWLLDHERAERLRVHHAQVIARHPDRFTDVQVQHARRLLAAVAAGWVLPANRFFTAPSRRAWQLVLDAHHGVEHLARRRVEMTRTRRRAMGQAPDVLVQMAQAELRAQVAG